MTRGTEHAHGTQRMWREPDQHIWSIKPLCALCGNTGRMQGWCLLVGCGYRRNGTISRSEIETEDFVKNDNIKVFISYWNNEKCKLAERRSGYFYWSAPTARFKRGVIAVTDSLQADQARQEVGQRPDSYIFLYILIWVYRKLFSSGRYDRRDLNVPDFLRCLRVQVW